MSEIGVSARVASVLERISQLSPTELEEVNRLLELLEIKRLRQSLGEAVDEALANGQSEAFCGFDPIPPRGGKVTDELINRIREGD